MKIERDTVHILSGVRHGKTIGSPIAIMLQNRDWQNWKDSLPVELAIRKNTSASLRRVLDTLISQGR